MSILWKDRQENKRRKLDNKRNCLIPKLLYLLYWKQTAITDRKGYDMLLKKIKWEGSEYDTPDIEELHQMSDDGVTTTPEGDPVEIDHEDGWFRLLGLI